MYYLCIIIIPTTLNYCYIALTVYIYIYLRNVDTLN